MQAPRGSPGAADVAVGRLQPPGRYLRRVHRGRHHRRGAGSGLGWGLGRHWGKGRIDGWEGKRPDATVRRREVSDEKATIPVHTAYEHSTVRPMDIARTCDPGLAVREISGSPESEPHPNRMKVFGWSVTAAGRRGLPAVTGGSRFAFGPTISALIARRRAPTCGREPGGDGDRGPLRIIGGWNGRGQAATHRMVPLGPLGPTVGVWLKLSFES